MTKMNENETGIEIEPSIPAKKSLIWLHGLGADGYDFVPIAQELALPDEFGMRFVFPHAPVIPVTLNNNYMMRAWYDIESLSLDAKIDKQGIEQSVAAISQLIQREESRGIPTPHIVLAGFSQGAVIALTTALTYTKPLGGVIALSGYLPFAEEVLRKASHDALSIFIAHGTTDPVVPFALGQAAYLALKDHYQVSWHSYPIAHSVSTKEIADIRQWLLKNK